MQIERNIIYKVNNHYLKIVRPVYVAGQLVGTDSLVEVSGREAADLKGRGLAIEATEAEVTAATEILASGTIDPAIERAKWQPEVQWGL